MINGESVESRLVQLPGRARTTLVFKVMEASTGSLNVRLGNVSGVLTVQEPSSISLFGLYARPYEVNPGDTVNITYQAYNRGQSRSTLFLKLILDGEVAGNRTIEVAGGADSYGEFQIIAKPLTGSSDHETHKFQLGGLSSDFLVVKNGYHTLMV
jgi:hypothetical protein